MHAARRLILFGTTATFNTDVVITATDGTTPEPDPAPEAAAEVADAAVEIARIEGDTAVALAVVHGETDIALAEARVEEAEALAEVGNSLEAEISQCRNRISELEALILERLTPQPSEPELPSPPDPLSPVDESHAATPDKVEELAPEPAKPKRVKPRWI